MDNSNYVRVFDLKSDEEHLHILICAPNKKEIPLPRAECVDSALLPHLPFPDQSFDLVLCPNVLFTNHNVHSEAEIVAILKELVRVGSEVRILPLVSQEGAASEHLGSAIQQLQQQGKGMELRQVVTVGGGKPNAMLRIWNTECLVK